MIIKIIMKHKTYVASLTNESTRVWGCLELLQKSKMILKIKLIIIKTK